MAAYTWRLGVGGDWGNAANWVGGAVPNASNADIAFASPGAITQGEAFTVGNLTLDGPGTTLNVGGLLRVSGAVTVRAGVVALHRGTIQGGTIVGDGTELAFGFEPLNTLDGVTVRGGLALNGRVVFKNGTTVLDAAGAPGAISLGTAQAAFLQLVGARTLHNAVTLANYSAIDAGSDDATATTLTLAADAKVSGSGAVGGSYQLTPGALVNDGVVTANSAGNSLTLGGTVVTNGGTLAAVGGGTLDVAASLTNAGTVVATGGGLVFGGPVDNAGTIVATNAQVEFTDLSTAGLGRFTRTGGRVLVSGTLDNRAHALNLLSGRLAGLSLGGTLLGGTILGAPGLALPYAEGAVLDGVTVRGDLSLTTGGLRLTGGTVVRTADGSAPGTVRDDGQVLVLQGTQAFHGAIALSGGATLAAGAYSKGLPPGPGTDALTLAADATVTGSGSIADNLFLGESEANGVYVGPAAIENDGAIAATVAGQSLSIVADGFDNLGGLSSVLGSTLTVAPTHLANLRGGTLDAGNYDPSGTIDLRSDAALTTIGGADRTGVQLDRQGLLRSWDATAAAYVPMQATLTTVAANGSLSLAADTVFAHPLLNQGSVSQHDGEHTIGAPSVTNAAGANFLLWGTLNAPLRNDGVVLAAGNSRIAGPVAGAGELDLGTVTTLDLASIGTQAIRFTGDYGTLRLEAPAGYTGAFAGFTHHDTIDLAGLQADHAQYAGNVLTLYAGQAVVDQLHVAGPSAAELFVVSPDGAGGTSVRVNDPPVLGAPAALAAVAGGSTPLAGLSLQDADARFPDEALTVQIQDFLGVVSAGAGSGGAAITGARSALLTIQGGLFDVQQALGTLSYASAGAGSDTVWISAFDGRGGVDTRHVAVTVAPAQAG